MCGWTRERGERKIYRGATVRANQTRRGASPAQIFHSYGQINHDLSAGCTAVWGIERINDATFGRAASNARLSSLREFIVAPIAHTSFACDIIFLITPTVFRFSNLERILKAVAFPVD